MASAKNKKPKTNKNEEPKQPDLAMQRDLEADKKEHVKEAREQADTDIEKDADLSIHSPNDDLDEGETARLGEDVNDII
jgi:hypothetical protein